MALVFKVPVPLVVVLDKKRRQDYERLPQNETISVRFSEENRKINEISKVITVITISGTSDQECQIVSLKAKIENMLHMEPKLKTHFLNFPLTDTDFVQAFERFKGEVIRHLPHLEQYFIPTWLLHLTFGHLFVTKKQEYLAKKLFQRTHETIKKVVGAEAPLKITIAGLQAISYKGSGTVKKCGLILACVKSDELQVIANRIHHRFRRQNLMPNDIQGPMTDNNVNLSIPILSYYYKKLNAKVNKYRNEGSEEDSWFDAEELMNKYQKHCFVDNLILPKVHLSCHLTHDRPKAFKYFKSLDERDLKYCSYYVPYFDVKLLREKYYISILLNTRRMKDRFEIFKGLMHQLRILFSKRWKKFT